ncbi:protein SCO1/2 [Cyclonatronum proteinivorum]|uniref:Protein SCO1/2 n=1 Tax=Cyclonatronum proteinivorum TaxID=1457365 RepID=A0A345UP14_9BACT|nr:protein SCO1/2 [Cyclonatronum proteinivorum]
MINPQYSSLNFSVKIQLLTLLLFTTLFATDGLFAQTTNPATEANARLLEQLQIQEQLGEYLPEDLVFTNEFGEEVKLSSFFESDRPVLLNLIYFSCPSICSLILNGVADAVEQVRWTPGVEYDIVTISIDPNEDYQLASQVKQGYADRMNKSGIEEGWHFLTGTQENIDAISESVGIPFVWSEEAQEFLHGSAIMFISPEMRITRYLYGVSYREMDVRNALFDAAGGRVGSTLERIALYCFTFDPDSGSYVPYAMNIMKVGGVVILLGLGIFLGGFWLRERKKDATGLSFD